jgi:4'-phosphopantetheinyl transferase
MRSGESSVTALGSADVHVWLLEAPEAASAERAERCAALLSADERARMGRFHFAGDRRRYLFAHALVRTTLSRYAPATPPARWRFRENAHGRPELSPEDGGPPLRFNLSHTAGLVACAVALDRDVGVDVEHLWPPTFDIGLARHHFAPAEVAGLEALPPEARRAGFFALWTLKEAYIKARGLGLALPLERFAFDFEGPALGVRFDPELRDQPERWHFARLQPTAVHALALAARRVARETLSVRLWPSPSEFPWID